VVQLREAGPDHLDLAAFKRTIRQLANNRFNIDFDGDLRLWTDESAKAF